MSFSLAINLPPPPKKSFSFPIILSVCQFEISVHIRLNSALVVGCVGFFGCLKQSFLEGIIKPYEGTILTSCKVCFVQYLLIFRLLWCPTGVCARSVAFPLIY